MSSVETILVTFVAVAREAALDEAGAETRDDAGRENNGSIDCFDVGAGGGDVLCTSDGGKCGKGRGFVRLFPFEFVVTFVTVDLD
jgi:hypothetical protein